ncbi:MAG: DUF4397 domain-containing protein [Fimbriimonadaceae bacterium]|nr:DUF4397 domain-containing protein [Fimbriimonadaceae bacterium]QYK57444.1 MAG: DUF4397 domain-containing protein [Fimbriimonadaceae bacterium]
MIRLRNGLLAAMAVFMLGCGGMESNPSTARVRVLNAAVSLRGVDVVVDGARAATGLAFSQSSVPRAVPAGFVDWAASAPGDPTPLARGAVRVAPGSVATLILAPGPQGPVARVAPEDRRRPSPGVFRTRFADLRSSAGPVDVYVVTPGDELPEVVILAQNLKPGEPTPYADVPEGEYELLVTQAGNPLDVVFTRSDLSKGGKVFSLYLADPDAPGVPDTFIQVGELP